MIKVDKKDIKAFVALAMLAASSIGIVNNCIGVFYNAMAEALNEKRGAVTAFMTILSLVSAVSAVYIPKIMNRQNFKKILLAGNLMVSVSLVLIGQAKSIVLVYILAVIAGIGFSCFSHTVVNLLITNNISNNVGKMTSLIFLFTGITGIVLSPLLTAIIESSSYSIAYVVSGSLCFLLALPCQFVDLKVDFKKEKKEESTTQNSTGLFILFAVMSFLFFIVSNFPQHLLGYSEVRGFSAQAGSILLSFAMVGNVLFKPLNGILADKLNSIYAAIVILLVNLLGLLLIYFAEAYWVAAIGCVLYGTHYTMTSFMHSMVTKDVFKDSYYSVFPKVLMVGFIGSAVASVLIGSCYDWTGSYDLVMLIIAGIDIFNILALAFLSRKKI